MSAPATPKRFARDLFRGIPWQYLPHVGHVLAQQLGTDFVSVAMTGGSGWTVKNVPDPALTPPGCANARPTPRRGPNSVEALFAGMSAARRRSVWATASCRYRPWTPTTQSSHSAPHARRGPYGLGLDFRIATRVFGPTVHLAPVGELTAAAHDGGGRVPLPRANPPERSTPPPIGWGVLREGAWPGSGGRLGLAQSWLAEEKRVAAREPAARGPRAVRRLGDRPDRDRPRPGREPGRPRRPARCWRDTASILHSSLPWAGRAVPARWRGARRQFGLAAGQRPCPQKAAHPISVGRRAPRGRSPAGSVPCGASW